MININLGLSCIPVRARKWIEEGNIVPIGLIIGSKRFVIDIPLPLVINLKAMSRSIKKIFNPKRPLLGVDLGSHSVKIVQLARNADDSYRLVACGEEIFPQETIIDDACLNCRAIVTAIQKVLADQFSGKRYNKRVSFGVQGRSEIIKIITLPNMTDEELQASIHWEAEQYIPFDINDVRLGAQIIEKMEYGQMDVLLVAVKKEITEEREAIMREAGIGLSPVFAAPNAFALANLFMLNYPELAKESVCLLDIGANNIGIVIMNNSQLKFTRDIAMGGYALTDAIQRQLALTADEAENMKCSTLDSRMPARADFLEIADTVTSVADALLGEIHRTIDFFNTTTSGHAISKILVMGNGQFLQLRNMAEKRLGAPVEIFDPFKNIQGAAVAAPGYKYAVACGLALFEG